MTFLSVTISTPRASAKLLWMSRSANKGVSLPDAVLADTPAGREVVMVDCRSCRVAR